MGSALRTNQPHEALPPEIYLPLVDSLFKEGRTLFAGTILGAGSIFITYWKTGEPLLLYCAIAVLLVAALRGLVMRAYQRARPAIKTVEAARRWEHIYVAGAATSIALLGLWCYLAFARTSDPFTQLVSFSMTIAYTTGIFGRNFGSARFVVVQIFCAWAPITAALLIYGNIFHWIFAGLLVPAFLALKFIADRLRSTLLDAVVSSRDMSLLAKRFDTAINNMPHGLVHVRLQAPGRRFERQAEAAARARERFRAEGPVRARGGRGHHQGRIAVGDRRAKHDRSSRRAACRRRRFRLRPGPDERAHARIHRPADGERRHGGVDRGHHRAQDRRGEDQSSGALRCA